MMWSYYNFDPKEGGLLSNLCLDYGVKEVAEEEEERGVEEEERGVEEDEEEGSTHIPSIILKFKWWRDVGGVFFKI